VETETGKIQKNRYDAEGLRYELIENGRRTSFVYHNGELLHEKGEEAGLFQRESSYHLGAGIEAFEQDRKTFYYHQDEQLNTTLISDNEAKIRNHYQYDAFGAGLDAIEALPNRIRYTGQQYDEQTGQYYLQARYYNPVLGRFMQEDVYQGDGMNLYAYCHNNPVVYYDSSGYSCHETDKINDGNDMVMGPNNKLITKKYDSIAYNGYFTNKNENRKKYVSKNKYPRAENAPDVVRRYCSKKEYKEFKKNGFKYDSEISGWGLSATYTSLKPVGKDRIRTLTGAKGADFFVDINVKGKNLGYKGDTKGGWPDFKIRFDFEPEDIVNSGKVK